jgi:hypothetical protein|tara:strand:+ start:1707 stop:2618 length:912 start_codon:yes stop_codon:yes gene_type:complete
MEETMQQEENLAIEETVEVELPTEEKKEENIEIVDSQPEEQPVEDDKTEQEEYSDSVQKRINKLTYKLRETERQNEEAVSWAQKVQEENATLKKKAESANTAMFSEYDNRINTELDSAKAEYKDALDRGDTEAVVSSNEKLARLSVEAESLRRVTEQRKRAAENPEEKAQQPVMPAANTAQPAPPDPRAQEWAKKNDWFGKNQGLTFAAFGVHRELMDEGYDGATDDYYAELDNRLSKFGISTYNEDQEQVSDSPVQRVASPTRQARSKNARSKTVKLTQSQVAIAKKLGVPLEEYAKYVKTQ